jgi:hypothetical protein
MDEQRFFAEVDLVADRVVGGSAMLEKRLPQIALEIARLYRTDRPAAPAAEWVIE